jgi:hypothetical protein
VSRIGALDYRQAKHKTSLALDSHCLPLIRRQGVSIKGNHMAKFPKGRFKLEAVQPCQPFNYSFNISGYGAPLLSIAYPTKDEADAAHAKIAEALEKAVEVGQPGRVAKESAEVTQGPSLWR